jgi:F-type H+/Na+-transporting ATPase subunit alpha
MQKQINRGKILREILKQDTLSPLPIEFELAWVIAYNDGLFDEIKLEEIPSLLNKIQSELKNTNLTLSSSREQWKETVTTCLMKATSE